MTEIFISPKINVYDVILWRGIPISIMIISFFAKFRNHLDSLLFKLGGYFIGLSIFFLFQIDKNMRMEVTEYAYNVVAFFLIAYLIPFKTAIITLLYIVFTYVVYLKTSYFSLQYSITYFAVTFLINRQAIDLYHFVEKSAISNLESLKEGKKNMQYSYSSVIGSRLSTLMNIPELLRRTMNSDKSPEQKKDRVLAICKQLDMVNQDFKKLVDVASEIKDKDDKHINPDETQAFSKIS